MSLLSSYCQRLTGLFFAWLFVTGVPLGFAAPPDFSQVPAEINWLVHLDFDGLQRSTVFRAAYNRALDRWPVLARQTDAARRRYGLDLAKDVHSMTIFNPRSFPDGAVLVMRANWAAETFREKLAGAANHSIVADGPYEIHRVTKTERGRVLPIAAALWKPGTFVFGPSSDDVKTTLEVFDGKQPGLSDSSSLAAEVPAGTVLTVRMVRVGDSLPVESPLLKRTERIELLCGENDRECFISGALLAKSAETAEQVMQFAQGLLAVARLQAAGDPEAGRLLDGVKLRREGSRVSLDFHGPAADVSRLVKKALENR